ncbi:MAG: pyridoxal phosphate-dependent aminotransferase, partial [Oscillospiraceae bacterium]
MVSKEMFSLGYTRSVIRDLFEYGRVRAKEVGEENVFDFSLGNPSIPAPAEVQKAIVKIISESDPVSIHGYTSAVGSDECRQAIADNLNRRLGTDYGKKNVIVTCGAAPALVACLKAVTVDENSEVIAIAPYFPEYKVFAQQAGAKFTVLPADTEKFQIDFGLLEKAINSGTQAVIVNSPNNPSGTAYSRDTIEKLADILEKASKKAGHPIYLISDEPYRELVYRGISLPHIPDYYKDTIISYSYSKSLSLPGERIGYVLIPDTVSDFDDLFYAVTGALRASGHVCAPSLMQRVIVECADVMPDVSIYEKNSELIYKGLTDIGYSCARPDGAFYLFFRAPFGMSGRDFSELAKKYNVLVVPGDGFGCPDFLRLSYCVKPERLEKALPLFAEMYEEA